jgi:uncharacterized membrane protein
MANQGNLWAVAFDGTTRAGEVRDAIIKLGSEKHDIALLDIAVAVRFRDGTLALNGEAFPEAICAPCGMLAWLLASLALGAPPVTGTEVGRVLDRAGVGAGDAGISDDFVREMVRLVKPDTSVLFVLDEGGNIEAICDTIRGAEGTVLKTNVDLERAKLIQSTLRESPNKPIAVTTGPTSLKPKPGRGE